jgi:rSAM/selenodomain-associated transferase 2
MDRSRSQTGVKVSIVIPALNEEGCIAETVRSLRQERPHEILVVDGGSSDATRERAAAADTVLVGPRGRAAQMNQGAAHASGDVLLFLHADCTLEEGALASVRRALGRPGVIAGCFHMRVKAGGMLYRLIDFCATARVWVAGIVYGDQGLFLRRETFVSAGGFPPLGLMEDVFLSLELRKHGRIVVVPPRVFVSPRRWQRQGLVRQTLRNWTLTALAAAGVHPDRLAAHYPVVR